MDPIRLNPYNALSTTADLWIIPDLEESKWSQEIDYYINFQIAKSQTRTRATLDDGLKNVLDQEDLSHSSAPLDGPLMVVPQNNLPAKCILYLKRSESWLQKAHEVWRSLNRPSVKLFLPKGFVAQNVQEFWTSEVPWYLVEEKHE